MAWKSITYIHWSISTKDKGKEDKDKTKQWLTNGTLNKETEGLFLTAQEEAIQIILPDDQIKLVVKVSWLPSGQNAIISLERCISCNLETGS